ncbi:DUF1764-domain-containing protein [Serendipita vermifera]|nr:DUF1764-domain-containing protein [Serendipita vermifera]
MPASEIDDIFSGKISAKQLENPDLVSSGVSKKAKKKKDKKKTTLDSRKEPSEKKSKVQITTEPEASLKATPNADHATKKRKREVPEIIDATLPIKRHKSDHDKEKLKSRTTQKPVLAKFKDSRGSSGRKRTEEGYLVYTEEELGLNKEGGDTSLCPFDCECCY